MRCFHGGPSHGRRRRRQSCTTQFTNHHVYNIVRVNTGSGACCGCITATCLNSMAHFHHCKVQLPASPHSYARHECACLLHNAARHDGRIVGVWFLSWRTVTKCGQVNTVLGNSHTEARLICPTFEFSRTTCVMNVARVQVGAVTQTCVNGTFGNASGGKNISRQRDRKSWVFLTH